VIAYSQPNVAGKDEVEREYETQLLRRSYREDRKVKNETVENLSQAGRSPVDDPFRARAGVSPCCRTRRRAGGPLPRASGGVSPKCDFEPSGC
jgi:hypothetical protein